MSFSHLPATRLGLASRPTSRSKTPAARPCFPPMLEALEDRWLPSTLTVTSATDSGAGSLRAEIAAAQKGDTIIFAPSLNGQTIALTSGDLLIKKSLTISGLGANQLTVSGSNHSRVFEVGAGTQVALSGLTISNGDGVRVAGSSSANDGFGGGILNLGSLTVTNCTLSHNSLNGQGGGISNSGTLTFTGSTLSYNTATAHVGGGIFNGPSATGPPTVIDCTLSNNSANNGGGIANYANSTLALSNSTLSDNTVTSGGGGVFNFGTATINGGALSDNSAFRGGGIYIAGSGTVTVENTSSISGNTAPTGFGADVYNLGVLYLDDTSFIGILDGNPVISI